MQTIINIIVFFLILGAIVLIHELGHFLTAKLFGVYCAEFSIGMGPKLFSKKKGEKPSYRFFTESYYEIDVSSDPRPDEKEKAADESKKDKTEGETK